MKSTATTLAQISLYFAEGRSDKEYHAEIIKVAGGHVVNYRYGRRGASLTTGSKTPYPVELSQAQKIYDKLVKDKTAKGYTPDVSGVAYQAEQGTGKQTDFRPQLLNPITEAEAMRLIEDPQWAAQAKMDGERRAVHADSQCVIGINRRGLVVALPQSIAQALQELAELGAIRVDGELIGDMLYVFDLHQYQGKSLTTQPWITRIRLAQQVLPGWVNIKVLPVALSTQDKQGMWQQILSAKGEGVVFKRLDSVVAPGRPNSGGDWLKFKFTASASCCVMEVNTGRRSVRIGLIDSLAPIDMVMGKKMLAVGNVTIPPNYPIPLAGDIVEVEYLYAYMGGSLYQPVYRGKRVDVGIDACTTAQLKYKPTGQDDDEDQ